MATMSTFADGHVIIDDDWNAHANQINTNTDDISALTSDVSDVLSRYHAAVNQTISDVTWTKVVVGTADTSTDKVTVNAANDTFTIQQDGVYFVAGAARCDANTSGSRHIVIANGTDEGERWTGNSVPGGPGFLTPGASTSRFLLAGETVSLWFFQDTGASLDLVPSGESNNLTIKYDGRG